MYRSIDEGKDSVLLVAQEDDQIVGFVSGATGMGAIYRRMLRRLPQLTFALLPVLLSVRRLRRILEIMRYSLGGSDELASLPRAELLSIAVDPSFRGRGHAENLYGRLAAHFQSQGIEQFRIIVGEALVSAHKFYRRMGAEPVAELEVHSGVQSVIYVQRLGSVSEWEGTGS